MKRFYQDVAVIAVGEGFHLHLDGKPVKTPRKNMLNLASRTLAETVAEEWRAQGEQLQPHSMPLTQMANGVCDLTTEERARLAAHLAGYVSGDMLYFRVEENPELFARQEAEWEPWLRWAEQRYDVRFRRQACILPEPQPDAVMHRLQDVLARLPLAHLVPLNVLATGFGSLILGLAVYENALLVEEAFALSLLEQRVQTDRWGLDEEQRQRNEELQMEMQAAAHFLQLLAQG
jgi:chaperone required for assembly of F1-ATPase